MTKRARIRRPSPVRLVLDDPFDPSPPRRTNPHGWRFANRARRRRGKQTAEAMARRWERAGQMFPGNRGSVVAMVSGVSRAAAYQRLYRLRHGFYERKRRLHPGKGADLRVEFIYEPAPAPESER